MTPTKCWAFTVDKNDQTILVCKTYCMVLGHLLQPKGLHINLCYITPLCSSHKNWVNFSHLFTHFNLHRVILASEVVRKVKQRSTFATPRSCSRTGTLSEWRCVWTWGVWVGRGKFLVMALFTLWCFEAQVVNCLTVGSLSKVYVQVRLLWSRSRPSTSPKHVFGPVLADHLFLAFSHSWSAHADLYNL